MCSTQKSSSDYSESTTNHFVLCPADWRPLIPHCRGGSPSSFPALLNEGSSRTDGAHLSHTILIIPSPVQHLHSPICRFIVLHTWQSPATCHATSPHTEPLCFNSYAAKLHSFSSQCYSVFSSQVRPCNPSQNNCSAKPSHIFAGRYFACSARHLPTVPSNSGLRLFPGLHPATKPVL